MQTVSAKGVCQVTLIMRKSFRYLLVLVMLNNGAVHASSDDVYYMTTFFRLRVWVHRFITQLRSVRAPTLAWGKEEGKIVSKVEPAFTPNYQHLLIKTVLPAIAKLSEDLDTGVAKDREEKGSKWKTGAKLFGAALKMVIGIGFLQTGLALDCFEDFIEAFHGGHETLESLHTVAKTFKLGDLLEKIKFWETDEKKFYKAKSLFSTRLENNLNLLESALIGMELQMKANLRDQDEDETKRRENEKHFKAILEFQHALNTGIESSMLKELSTNPENKTYRNMFNRMARMRLMELFFPECTSPEVESVKRFDQLEAMVRENKRENEALLSLLADLRKKVNKHQDILRREEEEVLAVVDEVLSKYPEPAERASTNTN